MSELGTGAIRTIAEPFPATPSMHGLLASAYEVQSALVTGDGMFLERNDPAMLEGLKRSDPEAYDQIMRRWEIGGYSITPENCVESATWDPDCAQWPVGIENKPALSVTDEADRPNTYDGRPFAIDTVFECDAVGFQVIDWRGRVERQLAAGTPKAMEYEFATGALVPENPNLVTGSTVLGGGAAFSPREAFALLSQYLSNTAHGGIGMMHAPTLVVDEWLQDFGTRAIKEQGDRLRSVSRGDIIVSGAGYTGYGPGGIVPTTGQAWVYATSPVQYRLGQIMVFPDRIGDALDRAKNNIEYRAIRQAAVGFDPCRHAAVLVQTQFSGTPGGS
mgnify:FL=1